MLDDEAITVTAVAGCIAIEAIGDCGSYRAFGDRVDTRIATRRYQIDACMVRGG